MEVTDRPAFGAGSGQPRPARHKQGDGTGHRLPLFRFFVISWFVCSTGNRLRRRRSQVLAGGCLVPLYRIDLKVALSFDLIARRNAPKQASTILKANRGLLIAIRASPIPNRAVLEANGASPITSGALLIAIRAPPTANRSLLIAIRAPPITNRELLIAFSKLLIAIRELLIAIRALLFAIRALLIDKSTPIFALAALHLTPGTYLRQAEMPDPGVHNTGVRLTVC